MTFWQVSRDVGSHRLGCGYRVAHVSLKYYAISGFYCEEDNCSGEGSDENMPRMWSAGGLDIDHKYQHNKVKLSAETKINTIQLK